MEKSVTGVPELPKTIDIALLKNIADEWVLSEVGVSGSPCNCPVANLLGYALGVSVAVDYNEVRFGRGRFAKLSEEVSMLIMNIDNTFEGRTVPTKWFKTEVERIAG